MKIIDYFNLLKNKPIPHNIFMRGCWLNQFTLVVAL